MKKIFFLLLTVFLSLSTFSQRKAKTPNYFSIGVEYGSNNILGDINEKLLLRGLESNNLSYRYISRFFYVDTKHYYLGIKPEYTISDNKLTFSSGIRLNTFISSIKGKNNYHYGNKSGYFFLKYNEDENSMKLARIKSISETTHYVGIPFEVKYVPLQWKWFGLYIKAGTEFGLSINKNFNVDFLNQEMQQYEDKVIPQEILKGANPFYSTVYGAFGLRTTLAQRFDFNIETTIPTIISTNNVTLIQPKAINGVQISIKIPLTKRNNENSMF